MPVTTHRRLPLVFLSIVAALLAACGREPVTATVDGPGGAEDDVVYGTDGRQDVYAHPTATLRDRAAQATVALMRVSTLNTANPDAVTFNAPTLQVDKELCSTERFLNDPTAAYCSGTLIDDDLVLTAGHCVTSAGGCLATRFVFNYYRTSASTLHAVSTADIFSCAAIVVREERMVGNRELDYAILRLDRPATPRFTPAPVRGGNSALARNAGVAVIGSGSGIPYKIDSGGKVRDGRSATLDYFVVNTDTFEGNSGSGVYETTGYTVAGILVRGDTDYRLNGSCYVVNTCSEGGGSGEGVSYVATALSALCATSTSLRLCGTTPVVSVTTTASFRYSAANTDYATTGTTNKAVHLAAGDTLAVGTCNVTGAVATGDTYLRLFSGGVEVAGNDDACGGQASYFEYTATGTGEVEIRAGCYSTSACGGTVAYVIR